MSSAEQHRQPAYPWNRARLIIAGIAGLCWAGALALLLLVDLQRGTAILPLFYGCMLAAPILTFAPIEQSLELPGLTIEGSIGSVLLLYSLAHIPAPNGSLLDLPELPIYVLLISAVFLCVSAVARPFISVISRRIFSQRARARDLRRVQRQSYEIGLLFALAATMAGLRVLNIISLLLLCLAIVIAELLFLAVVRAET